MVENLWQALRDNRLSAVFSPTTMPSASHCCFLSNRMSARLSQNDDNRSQKVTIDFFM
jgi:hypothetical protein